MDKKLRFGKMCLTPRFQWRQFCIQIFYLQITIDYWSDWYSPCWRSRNAKKKIQIHYTLLKTSIFVQNFNLRKITIFSARWILSKRFVSFVKIEFLDKNYNQGIMCCKSTYTKVWKSRRIWQTPVVHLQTRALQAPSAKSEAAKYVEFWEIWNFGSKNTLIC